MRPVKLTMSAFGPYADVTEVDFEVLGTSGVYLICGDTGSGKTMIFDAICFALFGEASGDARGGARSTTSLRSDYAQAASKTYVELVFEYRGKRYRVRRSPDYLRAKERGEGTTRQRAEAELELPDGRVVSKVRNVNAEIEQLLGIDAEQFKQIVMLAQGEFRKLLTADTELRESIFRKLFGTARYEAMQEYLAEQSRALERGNAKVKTEIATLAKQARFPEGSPEADEFAQRADEGRLMGPWLKEVLEQLVARDAPAHAELDAQVDALRLKWSDASASLKRAQARAALQGELAKLEAAVAQLRADAPKLQAAFEAQCARDSERAAALDRAAVLEGSLAKYESAAEAQKECDSADARLNRAQKARAKADTAKQTAEEQVRKAAQRAAQHEGAEGELAQAQIALVEAAAACESAEHASKSAQSLVERQNRLERAVAKAERPFMKKRDELQAGEARHAEKLGLLHDLQRRQRAGRAGLLAADLQEGEPCPVCGSRQHPRPAPQSQEIPTDEAIDRAAEDAAASEKALNVLSLEAERYRVEWEQACKAHEAFVEQEGSSEQLMCSLKKAEEAFDAAKRARTQANDRVAAARASLEAHQKASAAHQKAQQGLQDALAALGEAERAHREAAEARNLAHDRLVRLKADLVYESLAAAQKEVAQLREGAEALQRQRDAAERARVDNATQLHAKEELLKAKRDQLASEPAIDAQATQDLMDGYQEQAERLKAEASALKTRLDANRSCLAGLSRALEEAGDIEESYGRVKLLADAATGNLVGKAKVRFEAYVQAIYFDKVIAAANERLKMLTSGQFQLVRYSEGVGNAKAGLGLYVIDSHTGRARDASSLSGGESFQASLCLALGLSDVVQAHAGGVEFDTMFVDEGFGSLDQGALGNAISLLADLSGGAKLVGIISHVEDLKANIPKKLVVSKSRLGSSVSLEL